jgi:phage head maturation protease
MSKLQCYSGAINLNEEEKYIEAIVLHYNKANENRWMPMSGSLDAFFERLNKTGKGVAGCYQHDENNLIGVWRDFFVIDGIMTAKMYYVETPFVKDTVLPQVRAGILQGASPTVAPLRAVRKAGIDEIQEGVLCEISLVGLPADLESEIVRMSAMIEEQKNNDIEFELNLLT